MTINEVAAAGIKLNQHWDTPISVKLSSSSDSQIYEHTTGNHDLYIYGIAVEMIDADGKLVSRNDTVRDDIRLTMSNADGQDYMEKPIPVMSLVEMSNYNRFQGWVLRQQTKYFFEFIGQGNPNKGAYPLTINITLLGYKI